MPIRKGAIKVELCSKILNRKMLTGIYDSKISGENSV